MIEYRPIRGSDIPQIIDYFMQHLNSGQSIADSIQALWDAGDYHGYIALEDGGILGFMTICPGIAFTYPHPALEAELAEAVGKKKVAYCDALLVLPGHRNEGVASELASRVQGLLRQMKFDCLLAEAWIYPDGRVPAKPVYESLGKVIWQRKIDGFYRDQDKYGLSCPICGEKCVCSAWIELIEIRGSEQRPGREKAGAQGQGPMKQREKSRKSLNKRITMLIGVLMIVMFAAVSGISYWALRSTYLRLYNEKAQDIVASLASEIDGDKLPGYVETGETDEYYDWLQHEFNRIKKEFSGIQYLYLFYPEEDRFIYIVDGFKPTDDLSMINVLGDEFEYGDMEYKYLVPDIRAGQASTALIQGADVGYGRTISAWAPVFDSNDRVAGMVEADCILSDLNSVVFEYAKVIVGVQLVCMLLVLLLVVEVLQRNVTEPIGRLVEMVDSYEHGAVSEPKFRHDDEFQRLGTSFSDMTHRIDAYTEEVARATAEKGRISAEYNVAKQIQTDILPSTFPAFPDRREFDVYASLYSSKEICGDFFDFFLIDEDHLALVLGDVSGKGVPAAMFMVIVKTLIKNRALQGFSPAEVLQNVSEQVLEGNNASMFATVWLAVLELSTGKGIAANAGQEHPTLRRAGKRFELQEYRHSPPVGAMEGVRFRDHGFQLEPGDTLLVYTDGVSGAENGREESFGRTRLLEVLNREPDATPSVLLQSVKTTIDSFSGEKQQLDDMTMLALKYYGKGSPSDEWK